MALYLATMTIVLLALFIRYKLGFGFSLAVIPLYSLLTDFNEAFRTATILEVVVSIITAIELWRHVRLMDSILLKITGLLGAGLGSIAKSIIPLKIIIFTSMFITILACAYFLRKIDLRFQKSRRNLGLSGLLSGLLNSWSSLSGPPVVIYYLSTHHSDEEIKGALAGYFLLLYPLTFLFLFLTDQYNSFNGWGRALFAAGIMLLCYSGIRKLARRIEVDLRKASLIFITLAAISVIIRELL